MTIESTQDIVTLLASMQATLTEVRCELIAVRSELGQRPAMPTTPRESYSTEEVAKELGKSEYTVREYCRLGRINATKREERRGGAALWSISADELVRLRNEGLVTIDPERNAR